MHCQGYVLTSYRDCNGGTINGYQRGVSMMAKSLELSFNMLTIILFRAEVELQELLTRLDIVSQKLI